MKLLLVTLFWFILSAASAQGVAAQQPVEHSYNISTWWWIIGVLIALGIGVLIYLLIKKDPEKDAVR